MAPALSLATALFLLVVIVILANRRSGYSHWRSTISELGEIGAPLSHWASWGLFLPVGLSMAYVAVAVKQAAPTSSLLAACLAAGYLVAALFPCDPGSPLSGSLRQGIHNLGGGVEYIGGAYAVWQLGNGQPTGPIQLSALLIGIIALLLSSPVFLAIRGLLQRIAECLLSGWLIYSLVVVPR